MLLQLRKDGALAQPGTKVRTDYPSEGVDPAFDWVVVADHAGSDGVASEHLLLVKPAMAAQSGLLVTVELKVVLGDDVFDGKWYLRVGPQLVEYIKDGTVRAWQNDVVGVKQYMRYHGASAK